MILMNNRPQEIETPITVEELLKLNRFTYRGIVVKINGKVIEEEEYETQSIQDGDDVKIIHICHGG